MQDAAPTVGAATTGIRQAIKHRNADLETVRRARILQGRLMNSVAFTVSVLEIC